MNQYDTEEKCEEVFFKNKFPDGFICPVCKCKEYYPIKRHIKSKNGEEKAARTRYQCKNCKHQTSVTEGTIMDRSHLSLKIWLWAIYLVTMDKRGCSASMLSQFLCLPYKTSWHLLQRIRKAMQVRNELYQLAERIEFDHAFLGAPGGKRGAGTSKAKIAVAVSKQLNGHPLFLRMNVVKDLKADTVEKYAEQYFVENSTIYTDSARAYLSVLPSKYKLKAENFGAKSKSSKHLFWIHVLISNMKSFILGTYHGIKGDYLQLYLDEFSYRFNRRFSHCNIFERLIVAVCNCPTVRADKLCNSVTD